MKCFLDINENYLNHLKNIEPRIPNKNYGDYSFKPFFGVLFENNDFYYITQISSFKTRHNKVIEQKDFKKIYNNNKGICVINLNYMFLIPKKFSNDIITKINYTNISNFRKFKNEKEKNNYITLLRLELSLIKKIDLESDAIFIYNLKYSSPQSILAQRCFDFKSLEQYSLQWKKTST